MKINHYLLLVLTIILSACATDIVDLSASISGVVKDANSGALIQNCSVTLGTTGRSVITGSDGSFSFTDVDPGTYELTFKKAGYEDATKSVSVVSGQNVNASIMLSGKSSFAVSEKNLDFGDLSSAKDIYLFNNSDVKCSYEIKNIPSWASFSKTSGTIDSNGGQESISIIVNRDALDYGTHTHTVSISYSGKTKGDEVIVLKVEKVKLTEPSVSIASSAEDIKQSSFNIRGTLQATGGSQVTSYGHCWSLSKNPTINDQKTNFGSTNELGEFTSSITGLSVGTTYYVRAYATNNLGTSYSNEVAVTTQDVTSNKWDGNIAKDFAGGSGSPASPYQIETGGQLLLMKDYPDKNFIIKNNIDLDNRNWKPFDFKGNLDGNGCTIMNLKIDRDENYLGLFSNLSGKVENFTVKGVQINAENSNNVGAIAGYLSVGTDKIENVHVIFTEDSYILGKDYVGGIAGHVEGYADSYGDKVRTISNCSVSSVNSSAYIGGNNYVGGICGYVRVITSGATAGVESCQSSISIKGGKFVGGIIGGGTYGFANYCSYSGNITGDYSVAGIYGDAQQLVFKNTGLAIGCKVDATIKGNQTVAGVTIGYAYGCYSVGTISGNPAYGVSGEAYHCYSTMTSNSATFYGVASSASESATTSSSGANKVNCTDITTYMKECYSDYANYWNFNNTWTWKGKVNGVEKSVSCPRLAWE